MPTSDDFDDDDFSDLDAIISESEERRASAKRIGAKQRRLAYQGVSEDEKLRLLVEIRQHEERYVWLPTANIALFHTQVCLSCTHKHRFFMGWMTLQEHRNDPHCRRYLRGRSDLSLPARIEEHSQPEVEICSDCAEAALVVEQMVRAVNTDIEAQQAAATLAAQRARVERLEEENERIRNSLAAGIDPKTGLPLEKP